MDRFGRRFTIQMGAFICLVGAVLQTAAQNLAMMLVGRILAGWAVGLLSMSVPVYQAECAHPRSRGFIIGLSQQMIGIGFIVSTYVFLHLTSSDLVPRGRSNIDASIDGSVLDRFMLQKLASSNGVFLWHSRQFLAYF